MDMIKRLCFLLGVLCLIASCSGNSTEISTDPPTTGNEQGTRPNIVFLLIDDLGLSSVPCGLIPVNQDYGWTSTHSTGEDSAKYEYVNIASFARESRVYTNMYATALCAPSRGALITGRYPFRNGMVNPAWPQNDMNTPAPYYPNNFDNNNVATSAQGYLDTNQVGYPEVLQAMGYNTVFGGKWNLRYGSTMCSIDGKGGGSSADYMDILVPTQAAHLNAMGFNQTFGPIALVGNTIDYYPPQLDTAKNLSKKYLSNTIQEWMATQAIAGWGTGKPQYLHYCFGLIHDPFGGKPCQNYGYSPPPSDSGDTDSNTVWAAKVDEVDMLIGQFVALIDSLDRANGTSTMIILAGDNGTEDEYYSSYKGTWVQGGKSTNTSNGSRVPFMVRWPGKVKPGVDAALADFTDIFPTMVELVGGTEALGTLVSEGNPNFQPSYKGGPNPKMTTTSYVLDGQSLLHEMTDGKLGKPVSPREAVYTQSNSMALLANSGYKLGINQNVGFYRINNNTLVDSLFTTGALITAIGNAAAANPFEQGTAQYENYDRLVAYYNQIFPLAASGK